jgi:hypothetical protein
VQARALAVAEEYGKDSPELDEFLQKEALTEEDLDDLSDAVEGPEVRDSPSATSRLRSRPGS